MLLTFQPLSTRAQQRERNAIAAAARENNNIASQRGMFSMQLKAPYPHPLQLSGCMCYRAACVQSHLS